MSKAKDEKPDPDISPEVQSWIKNVIVPALVDEFLASHPEIIGLPKREGPEECMDRSWSIGRDELCSVLRNTLQRRLPKQEVLPPFRTNGRTSTQHRSSVIAGDARRKNDRTKKS